MQRKPAPGAGSAGSLGASGLQERTRAFEAVFRRTLEVLRPGKTPPRIRLRFHAYARLRSSIRYDTETRSITASLSDMLADAPMDVVEALATKLLAKLYCLPVPREVNSVYARWVRLPATQERMLEARRDRGVLNLLPARGRFHDLEASFDRINELQFAGRLSMPVLGWNPSAARKRLGHYDAAHNAIAINPALDSPDVPGLVLDYVVFHEMLHMKHPPVLEDGRRCVHTPEFRVEERRFHRYREARRALRTLRFTGP